MTAGRQIVSQSQDWGTPKKYVDAVERFFGGAIDLDPCSNEHAVVQARVQYMPPEDGLHLSWDHETIYVNPPYGRDSSRGSSIKDWLARCANAHEQYSAEVLALVPVATNTRHWKLHVFGRAFAVCFLYDTRLRFLVNGNNGGKGAPMACAMVYWGRHYERFHDVFIEYGAVVDLHPLHGVVIGQSKKEGQTSLF